MNLRGIYARWKVNTDRSRMYFAYLQFFMIGVVLLKDYQHTVIGGWVFTNQFISMPVLFMLMVLLSISIGYVDKKLWLREHENSEINKHNVEVMQILQDLQDIKKLFAGQGKNCLACGFCTDAQEGRKHGLGICRNPDNPIRFVTGKMICDDFKLKTEK